MSSSVFGERLRLFMTHESGPLGADKGGNCLLGLVSVLACMYLHVPYLVHPRIFSRDVIELEEACKLMANSLGYYLAFRLHI